MDALWKGSLLLVPCPLPLGFLVLCIGSLHGVARRSGPLFLRLLPPPKKGRLSFESGRLYSFRVIPLRVFGRYMYSRWTVSVPLSVALAQQYSP